MQWEERKKKQRSGEWEAPLCAVKWERSGWKTCVCQPEPMSTTALEQLLLFFSLALHVLSTSPKITFCVITIQRLPLQTYRKYDSKTKTQSTCSQLFLLHSDTGDSGAVSFMMKFLITELKLTHTHPIRMRCIVNWMNFISEINPTKWKQLNRNTMTTTTIAPKSVQQRILNENQTHRTEICTCVWIQSICKTIVYNLNGENKMHVRCMRARFVIFKHKKK